MSKQVRVSEPLYEEADRLSEEKDVSLKEAISIMARDGGYDV